MSEHVPEEALDTPEGAKAREKVKEDVIRTLLGEMPEGEARVVALASSPDGASYRGKAGCQDFMCSVDGSPDRCYGWHCLYCDGRSNCQGACWNRDCPGANG